MNKKGAFLLSLCAACLAAVFLLGACSAQPAPVTETTPQTVAQTTVAEAEETVPAQILKTIEEADRAFAAGEYADAQQGYRKAERAIKEEESLSPSKRKELLDYVIGQKEMAQDITATARIHFGNAMMLQYEKRFEDALEELELALKAYPKYQDAIDALDSLQALMGLNG